jgi:hypothetical protein
VVLGISSQVYLNAKGAVLSMNSKIKIGLVGAKFAARFHFEGYQRVYGVPIEVVGLTSKSKESRDAFAAKHKAKPFDSLAEMLKEVDVVDICAPGYVHESAAVESFKAGKDVIVEKPFTGYYGSGSQDFKGNQFSKEIMLKEAVASSRRILEAADRSGKKLMYAEDWVYAPVIQRERESWLLPRTGGCSGKNRTAVRIPPVTASGASQEGARLLVKDVIR